MDKNINQPSKTIYVIVNGTETSIDVSEQETVKQVAERALEQTGNIGRPVWDFQFIHDDKTHGPDEKVWTVVSAEDVVFLSLRAGQGAAERPAEAPASSGHTGQQFYHFPNHGDDDGNNSYTIVYGNEEEDNENAEHFIITCEDTEEDAVECCRRLNGLFNRAPMMEKEFEVARNRVVELLDEKIALSKELQAHKDAIEQHITVLQESSLELDRIEREGKQLRKQLQEARAALEKIESLSKYKSDHDQILYDFKEIHEIATAVLSSPHDTQKL